MALNRSCSCNPKPLGDGKKYHYSVLYNYYEGPSSRRQGDHLISWNFLKDLNGKLAKKGYDKVMYHDIARPGSNIFSNLFSMVTESEKIVVLLTPEFLRNGWHKYSQQAAVKNLLDNKKTHKFVPIAINIERKNIPDDLGLSVSSFIFTDYKNDKVDEDIWEADEGVWDKVHEAVGHTEVHYEQNRHLHSESCDLTGRAVPVEIRIPHDRVKRLQSLETDSPHPAADSADGDGYRGTSRGNGRVSNENLSKPRSEESSNSATSDSPPQSHGDGRDNGRVPNETASEKSASVEPGDVDNTPMSIDIPSIPLRDTDTGTTDIGTQENIGHVIVSQADVSAKESLVRKCKTWVAERNSTIGALNELVKGLNTLHSKLNIVSLIGTSLCALFGVICGLLCARETGGASADLTTCGPIASFIGVVIPLGISVIELEITHFRCKNTQQNIISDKTSTIDLTEEIKKNAKKFHLVKLETVKFIDVDLVEIAARFSYLIRLYKFCKSTLDPIQASIRRMQEVELVQRAFQALTKIFPLFVSVILSLYSFLQAVKTLSEKDILAALEFFLKDQSTLAKSIRFGLSALSAVFIVWSILTTSIDVYKGSKSKVAVEIGEINSRLIEERKTLIDSIAKLE